MKRKLITNRWFIPVFSAVILVLYMLLFFFPIYGDKIIPLEKIEEYLWGMPIITLITPTDLFYICLSPSIFGLVAGSICFGRIIKRSFMNTKADKLYLSCLLAIMFVIPVSLSFLSTIFYEPIGPLACFLLSLIVSPIISSLIMMVVRLVSKKPEE